MSNKDTTNRKTSGARQKKRGGVKGQTSSSYKRTNPEGRVLEVAARQLRPHDEAPRLEPLATSPNSHPGYARPNDVAGRMKPSKFRTHLRAMARLAADDPEQTDRIAEGISEDLSNARR